MKNRKGDVTEWLVIAILAVVFLVLIITYIAPSLQKIFAGQSEYAGKQIKSLDELTKGEAADLKPKEYMDLLYDQAIKKYEEGKNKLDTAKLLSAEKDLNEYKTKSKSAQYAEGAIPEKTADVEKKLNELPKLKESAQQMENLNKLAVDLSSSEKITNLKTAIQETETKGITNPAMIRTLAAIKKISEYASQELAKPDDYKAYKEELTGIKETVVPGAEEAWTLAEDSLNNFLNKPKFKEITVDAYGYSDLAGEANLLLLKIYSYRKNCKKAEEYFKIVLTNYKTNKIITDGSGTLLIGEAFKEIINCYNENKDYIETVRILNFYKKTNSIIDTPELIPNYGVYQQIFSNIIISAADSVDCTKIIWEECNEPIKEISINKGRFIVNVKLTRELVKQRRDLVCYKNFDRIAECFNCARYNVKECNNYETESWLINFLGKHTWADTCKEDPCAVGGEKPCGYDPGVGGGNKADCCPNGQTLC